MPAWIHDREKRLEPEMRKTYGPEKAKQVAFAVATEQAHALDKSPKTWKGKPFGTQKARSDAKRKYDDPKDMQKAAAAMTGHSYRLAGIIRSGAAGERSVVEFYAKLAQDSRGSGEDSSDLKSMVSLSDVMAQKMREFVHGGDANKEGVTRSDPDQDQLSRGTEVEHEHTPDKATAERIALDHLSELPDYYTRLGEMEREGEQAKEASMLQGKASSHPIEKNSTAHLEGFESVLPYFLQELDLLKEAACKGKKVKLGNIMDRLRALRSGQVKTPKSKKMPTFGG